MLSIFYNTEENYSMNRRKVSNATCIAFMKRKSKNLQNNPEYLCTQIHLSSYTTYTSISARDCNSA